MKVVINNKSGQERLVTWIENGTVKTRMIEDQEKVEINPNDDLIELECGGSTLFVPTFLEDKYIDIVADQDIEVARMQINIVAIIVAVALVGVTLLYLHTGIIYTLLMVGFELIFVGMCRSIFLQEQIGDVVFTEQ